MNTSTPADSSNGTPHLLPVGIGASAGGIAPLKEFFDVMPDNSGMAFVVVLHLSPEHGSQLDAILQSATKMPVIQVLKTTKVQPNHVYVIPPTKYLMMVDGEIRLAEPQKTRGRRVAVDLLFRTMADAYHKNAIAIVLSGAGSDGTSGLKRVKEAGGICIVQDPQEAEYKDMPGHAIDTGLVDLILPVSAMPQKLLEIKRSLERFPSSPDIAEDDDTEKTPSVSIDALHDVLALVKTQTGHDFTNYKRPTMWRRVTRRLQVHGLEDIPHYLIFLQENPNEVKSLLRDLLISVTNFFRDKEAFAALEEQIPRLFQGKGMDDQVRVWCVACATGEEAYSLAILLSEYASKLANPPSIQVFASDIEEISLTIARAGRYDETIELDVSPQRLRRFFTKQDNGYVIKEEIRELVLFASHNILRDPPFSRIDLVVCRNLLIYLNRPTQEKIFAIFHFALRSEGMLFVGASESAESMPALFSPIDKKQRIYQARPSAIKQQGMLPHLISGRSASANEKNPNQGTLSSFAELHCRLIERFAPPSILVDENYDILHSGGNATSFLQFASGEPTRNLLKSVLPSIKQDLLAALFTAREEHNQTEARHVRISQGDQQRFINICVQPIESPPEAKGFFLVTFDEMREEDIPPEVLKKVLSAKDGSGVETVINRLEEELQQSKERLRLTIEEQETMVEELKASNEELQAMNEELRSATEDLETGREELQSVNEEMTTVNYELKEKMEEVSRGNANLQNLIASTNIGTIFLDRALQIQLYTPAVQELFNIIAADMGRPLEHITHKLNYEHLLDDAREVLRSLHAIEREVQSESDRWYLVRTVPYRTMDDHIDGVVITFVDFTERKQGEMELIQLTRESEQQSRFFDTALSYINDFTYMFDKEGRFLYSNKPHAHFLGMEQGDITGKTFFDLNFSPELATRLQNQIREVFESKAAIRGETSFTNYAGQSGFYEYIFSPVLDDKGEVDFVAGTTRDITDRKEKERALREADIRKDEFLATLAHELRNPLAPIHSGLELIRRSKGDPKITQRTLGIIERQTNRIIHLVDDLLEVARITQGKITLRKERFDLKTAIDTALETSRETIESNKHIFTLSLPDEPIYLHADLVRVEQILLNLLTNAAKYTPANGKIWLSARQEKEEVVISVRDNGIGLPAELTSTIFEMFNQADDATKRACNGLGIGLGVVKKLVELHGGSITVFSEGRGKGSEFTVRLPLAGPMSEETPPLVEQPLKAEQVLQEEKKPQAKKRILIVDDNKDVTIMLQALLSMEGYLVRVAADGETGLEMAKEYQPDICLCDIGLPKMDGYELARGLRKLLPHARLIAFSGWGQDLDRQRSREAGFDDHIVKAANMDELIKLIGQ